MLSEFLTANHELIVENSREKVAVRSSPLATSVELEIGIPLFLDQLITALQIQETTDRAPSDDQIGASAAKHGKILQEMGFTATQVIHDYGNVCQSITELAVKLNAPITTDEFRTLNRCLDRAMADAVSEFGRLRDTAILDDESARRESANDLRGLLRSSLLAYEGLKSGSVGLSGATGTLLGRNLMRMRDLIDRSLASEIPMQGEAGGSETGPEGSTKR